MTPFDKLLYSMRTGGCAGPRPFYPFVPKEPAANKQFRIDLLHAGQRSMKAAEAIWIMCARDLLFYVNTMCFIFEPREAKVLPFITYPYQDPALTTLEASIGHNDLVIEKSRDMGATWMCLIAIEHQWHFKDYVTALMLSRKEDLVDSAGHGDPKSLFAKLDFIHEHQPGWLKPDEERLTMHLTNKDNGSSIDGESTNVYAGTADRRMVVLLDEFSKMLQQDVIDTGTRATTASRIFNFTPQGTGNRAYELAKNPKFKKLTLHWSIHPVKAEGLYMDNGKQRSPWYDAECDRANHPMEVAQELDIDYLGSAASWFGQAFLDEQEKLYARPPMFVGNLDYERGTANPFNFVADVEGLWQLWCVLDIEGKLPPEGEYVIGADVAHGTGATPSTACVADKKTGEVVGEFSCNTMRPEAFAELMVAACKFFNGAYLIWEANGAGRNFGDRVWELGYRHIYFRTNEKAVTKQKTDFPGWWSTPESKLALLGEYRRSLGIRFINRSKLTIDEQRLWIFVPGKEVGRDSAQTPEGTTHGDRVVAQALANHALIDRPLGSRGESKPKVPEYSMAARREQRRLMEQVEQLY